MTSESREAILKARDLVKAGWCQGESSMVIDGKTCYCPHGAILEISGTRSFNEVSKPVYDYLRSRYEIGSLVGWNDDPSRTQAEVIALLESVANQSVEIEV